MKSLSLLSWLSPIALCGGIALSGPALGQEPAAPAPPAADPPAANAPADATVKVQVSTEELDPCQAFQKLYEEIPVDPAAEKLKADAAAARAASSLGNKQASVERYYKDAFFPQFTRCEKQGSFQEMRTRFLKELQACKAPATHDLLVDIAFNKTQEYLAGRYARSTKVNCLLILGALNEKEGNPSGTPPTLAVPLKKALPVLLNMVDDPQESMDLKIVAMIGINRHATALANDASAKDSLKRMFELAQRVLALQERPSASEAEGFYWFKSQAAELMGNLGPVAASKESIDQLVAFLQDEEAGKVSISLQAEAARALGRLPLAGLKDFDAKPTLKALSRFLINSFDAEKARVSGGEQGISPAALRLYSNSVTLALNGPPAGTGAAASAAAANTPKTGLLSLPAARLSAARGEALIALCKQWKDALEDEKKQMSAIVNELDSLKLKLQGWMKSS